MIARHIIAIDPGPTTCGYVEFDATAGRVLASGAKVAVEDVLSLLRIGEPCLVAIEQVQSQGQSGASLLVTSRIAGRLQQRAIDSGHSVILLYRREVTSALDVSGKGKDAQVRARMIERFGAGDPRVAVGTKATPGPCYGVSSHAWQALGLAVVAAELDAGCAQ